MDRSTEGLSVRPDRDGVLAGGLASLAGASEEAADALTTDEREDYATTDMSECDVCGQMKPSDEVSVVWVGGYLETFACIDCRECGPDVDRKIDLMRGK